jgi:hypothetical protein
MSPIRYLASLVVAVLIGAAGITFVQPESASAASGAATPIGAWFGIARPCTPPGGPAHPVVDQAICHLACNGGPCPTATFPVPEVTMIPTLLADGTVLADDFAAVGVSPPGLSIAGDGHTTAHGKWAFQGKVAVGDSRLERYQATFIWFQGRPPGFPYNAASPVGFFHGSVRPRFVTFFDKSDPDVMVGFIQPYLYNYTDANGIVTLQPGTPFPTPDPVRRLPAACDPADFGAAPYCLGTLQFTIRRILAE